MITKYLKKKRSCCCESESSAEKVGSNDDLITEVLLDLPASSLLRFKSVSKQWPSLITSPHFSSLHIRRPLRVSGLFIAFDELHIQYRYIPLKSSSSSRTLPSPNAPNGIRIEQSCNGLLFCTSYDYYKNLREFYVYNPTTCKLATIPLPQWLLTGMFRSMLPHCTVLAFDPSRSPHYKLVSAHCLGPDAKYQMAIYSSETQLWKVCGDQPYKKPDGISFMNGVYLNGSAHYKGIYFKIDEERLETMPMPPITHTCTYFGQSGGRLHLITAFRNRYNTPGMKFDVYEMEKNCSGWCVRYQFVLDLTEVYSIGIMGIVCGEREEDSFLVFVTRVDGFRRIMKYKFADKTLKMLFEIVADRGPYQPTTYFNTTSNLPYWSRTFEFIQSLSPV